MPRKPKPKPKVSDKRKAIAIGIILLIAFFGFDLFTNLFNIPNFLNPQSKISSTVTSNEYPYYFPTSGVVSIINNTAYNITFDLDFATQYYGILAEGTPFYLTANCFLFVEGQEIISSMGIGYEGASWYAPSNTWYIGMPPIYMIPLNTHVVGYGFIVPKIIPPLNLSNPNNYVTMYWATQGDYYPYLHIEYKNGTITDVLIDVGKVHVNGLDVLQQQEFNLQQADNTRRSNWIIVDTVLIPAMVGFTLYLLKINKQR